MELPQAEKQKLYDDVVVVLGNLTWKDAAQLIAVVMSNAAIQQRVTDVLQNYIKKNLWEELWYQDGLSRTVQADKHILSLYLTRNLSQKPTYVTY